MPTKTKRNSTAFEQCKIVCEKSFSEVDSRTPVGHKVHIAIHNGNNCPVDDKLLLVLNLNLFSG